MASFDPASLSTLLPFYYKRLFPCRTLLRWLSYGNNEYLQKREFAFVLTDDVYLRYRSYEDPLDFERDLLKTLPEKVDIGAVYAYRPKEDRRKKDQCPVERELVFDIDMTDYDDVRTCCSGAGVCKKCWLFMVVAVRIIDTALDQDFGFDERLWVFSGRRGVHCWVSDEVARKLTNNARSAIVDYLTVSLGGERTKTVELKSKFLHTSIKRACSILRSYFPKIVAQQGWLDSEEATRKMLNLIPDSDLRCHIENKLVDCESALQKWQCFVRAKREVEVPANCSHFVEEIMLQYAYPRLDSNVTKGINHLLKSPFCVHAKTGKICIPLEPTEESLLDFDPSSVPTLDSLYTELASLDKQQSAVEVAEHEAVQRKILDYKRTSLRPYIEYFIKFVDKTHKVSVEEKISAETMEF